MQVYTMQNGGRIIANNAADLVSQMRKLSFTPSRSVHEYMEEVAEAAKDHDRTARIPTDSVDNFVEALLRVGFIKMVEEHD